MNPEPEQRAGAHILVGILLAGVYLLSSAGHIFTYDGLCRMELARSLVERQSMEVPSSQIRGASGRRVLEWQPVSAILGVPLVCAGKLLHAVLTDVPEEPLVSAAYSTLNQWITALTGCLLVLLVQVLGYRRRTGILLALAFGLCSFAWPMAKDSFSAPLVGLLFVAYLLAVLSEGSADDLRRTLIACGLLALLLFSRLTCLPMGPGLLFLGLLRASDGGRTLRLRRAPWLLASAAVAAGFHLAWNRVRFGDPWTLGAAQAARTYFQLDEPAALFGHPLSTGLFGLLLSPLKGLVWHSPLVLAGLIGAAPFARRHPLVSLGLVLAVLPRLLLHAAYVGWDGQWCWGPRYIVATAITLLLPLAEVIERVPGRTVRGGLLVGLAAVGLISQIPAVAVSYHRIFYERKVAGLSVEPPPLDWSPHVAQAQALRHVLTLPPSRIPALVVDCPEDIDDRARLHIDAKLNRLNFWWVLGPMAGVPGWVVWTLVLFTAGPTVAAGVALARDLTP